jgi:hypothetical protein
VNDTEKIERSIEQLAIYSFLHDQHVWGRRGEVQEDGKVRDLPWEDAGIMAQEQYRQDATMTVGVMLKLGWNPPA